MTYRLFLDDDATKDYVEAFRKPPLNEPDWKIARSTAEAKALIVEFGIPYFIDFDHDLGIDESGNQDDAICFLKWLESNFPNAINKIQGYNIHSVNPPGREDIKSFMNSWRKIRGG